MQTIVFGQGDGQNSVITSTTKDAARISISATVYYSYQPHNLPKVGICFDKGNVKIYVKWPAFGRHGQDLAKIAKEKVAFTINEYSYIDFLQKRNQISLEISKKISEDYNETYFTDVSED
jgi:hypothetical protein